MKIHEPAEIYTASEIEELIDKAEKLGFYTGPGSALEKLTVYDLDVLVNTRQ
jgi:hypothetical protein